MIICNELDVSIKELSFSIENKHNKIQYDIIGARYVQSSNNDCCYRGMVNLMSSC